MPFSWRSLVGRPGRRRLRAVRLEDPGEDLRRSCPGVGLPSRERTAPHCSPRHQGRQYPPGQRHDAQDLRFRPGQAHPHGCVPRQYSRRRNPVSSSISDRSIDCDDDDGGDASFAPPPADSTRSPFGHYAASPPPRSWLWRRSQWDRLSWFRCLPL